MKKVLIFFLFSLNAHAELLPSGTIAAFDSSSCPTGWTQYVAGNQRTLLGSGSGNTDQLGGALTTRTYGSAGGYEYTTGVKAKAAAAGTDTPSAANLPASTSGIYNAYGAATYDADDTTLAGAKADSNMPPYYVITYCRKD